MSLFEEASLVITPNGFKAGKLYAVKGAGDLDVVRATSATRVNANGIIETVASNVPRIDYSSGGCPSILVESQRTNSILYSEQFDNIIWLKNAATISANATTSPSGTLNADKIVEDNTNDAHYIDIRPIVLNSLHTCSIYVKAAGRTKFQLREGSNGDISTFDLDNPSGNIKNVGNGWFRVTLTTTPAAVTFIFQLRLLDNSGNLVYTGNGTSGLFVWGAQLEAGSYATSYIPTTSAIVTRNADVISKTGISSLIGQTEGTMFIDTYIDNISSQTNDPVLCYIKGTSAEAYIEIFDNGKVDAIFYDGTNVTCNISVSIGLTNGRHKFAFAYKTNDFTLFLDGVQIGTDTNGSASASLNQFGLQYYDNSLIEKQYVNSSQLWKTRLTNAELAELTTL
jgi:hypothetical protein